jgi:hypothetical protein
MSAPGSKVVAGAGQLRKEQASKWCPAEKECQPKSFSASRVEHQPPMTQKTFEVQNERLPKSSLVVDVNEDSSVTIAEICEIITTFTSPNQVNPTIVGQIYRHTKSVSDYKAKRRERRNGSKRWPKV